MYNLYGYGTYWDSTYILVLAGVLLSIISSIMVSSTMKKYSKIRNRRGMTGVDAARYILNSEGLHSVQIECLRGRGGDHYDPRSKTLRLTESNYNSSSVTAVGVAAHECGHAIQHANGYAPLKIRSTLVPVANIGSRLAIPLILIGVLLSWNPYLIEIGVWAFSLAVLFQLVTLPVEFNASRRAVEKVEQFGLLTEDESRGCKKVLSAAAMTYVAAAAASILQFLRIFLLYGVGRRRS